jgi:hypothetical protein
MSGLEAEQSTARNPSIQFDEIPLVEGWPEELD